MSTKRLMSNANRPPSLLCRGRYMTVVSRSLIVAVITMLLLTPEPSHSAPLPSDEEVSGIVKACGGGRFQQIAGDLEGRISIWKRNAEASGSASREDLSAILKTVPQNQQISPENYKTFTDCILNAI
jgi:hypothetical protein